MTEFPVGLNPDFMFFATGGCPSGVGLCMISGLPAIFQVGGICLVPLVTKSTSTVCRMCLGLLN
ncbi:hypothetical protein QM365_05090 [Streptococcus sobrinus]